MSTSPLEYVNKVGYSALSAQRPLSVFDVRNVTLNNLCHYADGFGQVVVAWSGTKSTLTHGYGFLFSAGEPVGTLVAGVPYTLGHWSCPLRIRANGSSYKLRVRVAGASGTPGESVCFFATIGMPGVWAMNTIYDGTGYEYGPITPGTRTATITEHGDAVHETASTTSGTPAWLTGVSRGTNAWDDLIGLPADLASAYQRTHATTNEVGDAEVVTYIDASLIVFCVAQTAGVTGQLHGVYACEWIEPP